MKTVMRLWLPALVLAGSGCGTGAPEPVTTTVRGKVILNGQPVVGGLVVFTPHPERGGSGKSAFGETGPDGSYSLQVNRSNNIPPGWYRVSLAPPPPAGVEEGASSVFPPKLARPDLSGLEREIQAGKEHVFEFMVDVPKGD